MEWVPVVAGIYEVLFIPGVLDKLKRPGSATGNLAQVGTNPNTHHYKFCQLELMEQDIGVEFTLGTKSLMVDTLSFSGFK